MVATSSIRSTRVAVAAMVATVALVAAGCGASGDPAADDGDVTTTAAPADDGAAAAFGEMDDPVCGEGDATVEPDESGGAADVLRVGVLNDRGSDIRPGLNKDMWDASVAFSEWCNAQGGVAGLPIELVDLDAKIFEVEAAMTQACDGVFALVGGGLVQDDLMFSGKEASDFHSCGLIDVPGFSNSPEKANSNGQVQPVPNPGGSTSATWFADFAELFPEDAARWTVLWGDLPSLEVVKDRYEVAVEEVGGYEVLEAQSYPPAGADDWGPYVEKLKELGATSITWVGEAGFLTSFLEQARQLEWDGRALVETNIYDPSVAQAGEATEGTVVRAVFHPLEERDDWPAVDQYLSILDDHVEDPRAGPLGMQSFSAWLLFATAAGACGADGGVVTRTCVLERAAEVEDWTGGGLHAPQDPARAEEARPSPCSMLLIVEDGGFRRLFPEVGGDGDDVAGFHCPEDGVVEVPGTADRGVVDPDRPI